MSERLTPWETFHSIVTGWSLSDIVWILIGIGGVFLFYTIAVRRKKRAQATWMIVMFWIIGTLGWVFVFYMVGWPKITLGGSIGHSAMAGTCFIMIITTFWLAQKTVLWQKIFSGIVIATIGFSTIATFGSGNQPIGWALVMGFLLGLLLGLVLSSAKDMHRKFKKGLDDEISDTNAEKETEWKEKNYDRI